MMAVRCGDVVDSRDSGRRDVAGVDRGDRAGRAVHVAVRKDQPVGCGKVPNARPSRKRNHSPQRSPGSRSFSRCGYGVAAMVHGDVSLCL